MADDPFISLGENLGKLIFRKRNQRWADEEAEKDLKRKAFLQQIINDAAMERLKYSENKQDYREHAARGARLEEAQIGAEQREKAARDLAEIRRQEGANAILESIADRAQKDRMFAQELPIKQQRTLADTGNMIRQLADTDYSLDEEVLKQMGFNRRTEPAESESSEGSWWNPTTWSMFKPAPKKPVFNSVTARTTNNAAPPLPAPTAPPPPTAATDIPGLLDDVVSKNMPGRSMGRESQLFNELLGTLTNKVYRPANPR